jgi:hypothetical protein
MANNNVITYSLQVGLQIIGEVAYFPIWWYSVGLGRFSKKAWNFLKNCEDTLGFSIWLKNIFIPMYGQRDLTGRLVSFFIRLVQIIFRGAALCFCLALALAAIFVWLALPLVLILLISGRFPGQLSVI